MPRKERSTNPADTQCFTTSIQRWFNVLTLKQCWIDVVPSLCACWEDSCLVDLSKYNSRFKFTLNQNQIAINYMLFSWNYTWIYSVYFQLYQRPGSDCAAYLVFKDPFSRGVAQLYMKQILHACVAWIKKKSLLCFRYLSEGRFLLGALHRRSKFANFFNAKPFVVTTYAQKVSF